MQRNKRKNLKWEKIIVIVVILVITFIFGKLIGKLIAVRINSGDDVLGFLGAIIGVLGTYGAFYLGKLQENRKDKIQDKKELELLKNILEYTLNETDLTLSCMVEKYIELYKDNGLEGTLLVRCYESQTYIPNMIEELITDGLLEEDKRRTRKANEIESDDIRESKFYNYTKLDKKKYLETYYNICDVFNETNYKELVYDHNWYNYILNLPIKKNYKVEYIKVITNWFVFLSSDSLRSSQEKIDRLLEEKVKAEATQDNMKFCQTGILYKEALEVKKRQLKDIMDFINYRDGVVEVFEKLYDNIQREEPFIVSFEKFKEELEYDGWRKKNNLEKSELFGDY